MKTDQQKLLLECEKLQAEGDKLRAETAKVLLEQENLKVEGENLKVERAELTKPFFRRAGFYAAVAPTILAVFGLYQLERTGWFQREGLKNDLAKQLLQKETNELSGRLTDLRADVTRIAELMPPLLQLTDPQHQGTTNMLAVLDSISLGLQNWTNRDDLELRSRLLLAIGQSYQDLGDYRHSSDQTQRAVDLISDLFGPMSPETIDWQARLLDIFEHRGEFKDVYLVGRRVLTNALQVVTTNSESRSLIPNISQWIAFSSAEMGSDDALSWCTNTLSWIEDLRKYNDRNAAGWKQFELRIRFLEGRIYASKNDLRGALAIMNDVLTDAKTGLAPNHIWPIMWTAIYASLGADTATNSTDEIRFESLLTNAINSASLRLGPTHPDILMLQGNLARYLFKHARDSRKAEELCTNALDKLRDSSPLIRANLQKQYSEILIERKDFKAAEHPLLSALSIAQKIFPGPQTNAGFPGAQRQRRPFLEDLIKIYSTDALGKPDDEARYKKQLSEL
jgi:hypothetical protein